MMPFARCYCLNNLPPRSLYSRLQPYPALLPGAAGTHTQGLFILPLLYLA